MQIKFWGVRGSIPSPGKDTVKYGGNTPCVEVKIKNGPLIIIDSGSGIRELGKYLIQNHKQPITAHILLSHTHWDHIQGFPFFLPAFMSENNFSIYGPYQIDKKLADVLAGQMEHRYFPIDLEKMQSKIVFKELKTHYFEIENTHISTHHLNHTTLTLAYKIRANNKTIIYCSDTEPYSTWEKHKDKDFAQEDYKMIEFFKGADLLIHDAQYTPEEYINKIGWGHSSDLYALRIAEEADVKHLVLFHHDPDHSDSFLESMLDECKKSILPESKLHISLAAEGKEILI